MLELVLQAIAGAAIGAVTGQLPDLIKSVAGNRADAALVRLSRAAATGLGDRGTERNHDALRAVRKAQIAAVKAVVEGYDTGLGVSELKHLQAAETVVALLKGWIVDASRDSDAFDLSPLQRQELVAAVDATLAAPETARLQALREAAEARTLQELEGRAGPLPEEFRRLFLEGAGSLAPWFDIFGLHVGAALKAENSRFRHIFVAAGVAELREQADALKTALDSLADGATTRLETLTADIRGLSEQSARQHVAVMAALNAMPGQVVASLLANLSSAQAATARVGPEAEDEQARITALEQRLEFALSAGAADHAQVKALRAELTQAEERHLSDLAARDSAFAAELSVLRPIVEDIASTPEGAAALSLFNAGDSEGALAELDRLTALRDDHRRRRADREAASDRRNTAYLALEACRRGDLGSQAVLARFEEVVRLDSSDWTDWAQIRRLCAATGRLPRARQAALKAIETTDNERARSVAYNEFGDVARAEGDLPAARTAYEDGLAIAKQLSARDPGNTEWRRDLLISFNKLGDVARAEGDLPAARKAYEDCLAIAKELSARDPGNTEWRRDLSVSFERLGDVAVAEGDLPAARKAYEDCLAIAKELRARDPGNMAWRRDLSVSFNKLGDVAQTEGDLPAARKVYEDGLAIRQELSARDPGNAEWRRDVAVSNAKLAQLAEAVGDRVGAHAGFLAAERAFRDVLAISPGHAETRRMAELAARDAARNAG